MKASGVLLPDPGTPKGLTWHLREKLFDLTDAFARNRLLRGICGGVICLIPLIIINAFFQFVLSFPNAHYQTWLFNDGNWLRFVLLRATEASGNYNSLLLAIAAGFCCGREYRLPLYKALLLALISVVSFGILTQLKPEYMDPHGMFTCVLAALISTFLYLRVDSTVGKKTEKALSRIPPRLKEALASIPPFVIVTLVVGFLQLFIVFVTGHDTIQDLIAQAATAFFTDLYHQPLICGSVYSFVTQCLWFVAINGQNVLNEINDVYFGDLLTENILAWNAGAQPVHIINRAFNESFVTLGGAGAIFGLTLAVLLVSRSHASRRLGIFSLPCNCIGVSEIIVFGLPAVANPIMFIPFALVPQVNIIIAYLGTAAGFIPVAHAESAWTTPVFLNSYIATGSLAGPLLQLFLILIDTGLYIPFVMLNDQRRLRHHSDQLKDLTRWCQKQEELRQGLNITRASLSLQLFATSLATDLLDAINNRDPALHLVYQPQFRIDGKCIGSEALLRWNHPRLGLVYPPLIIALARYGSFLDLLEEKVFMEAGQAIYDVANRSSRRHFKISVNITGESLGSDDVLKMVDKTVKKWQIDPEMLWIEITEQDAFDSSVLALQRFHTLRDRGHKLLIDDFGMGQTSVRYLQSTSFDAVKLDGSITRHAVDDVHSRQIIRSLASMCAEMNMLVIAEYVETPEQRNVLHTLGCNLFQGYLYSRPVSSADFTELIRMRGID